VTGLLTVIQNVHMNFLHRNSTEVFCCRWGWCRC